MVYFALKVKNMIDLEILKEQRLKFVNTLCQYLKTPSLEIYYEQNPKSFVRNIVALTIDGKLCKDILKELTPYMLVATPLERLYHVVFDFYEKNPVKCKICGNPTEFVKQFSKGYQIYCSSNCRMLDQKYINNKALAKYFKETGYKNPSQNPDVKKKKIETTIKHFGCSHINYSEEIKEKRRKKYFEKTGFNHPFQNPEIKNKIKQSHLEKTGFENPSFNPDIVKKRANTYRSKTGYDCSLQNPEIQDIIRQIHLKNYGVSNPAKSKEIQQKMSQTQKINFFKKLISSDRLKERYLPLFSISDYSGVKGNKKYFWKCLKCNTIFEDDIDNGNLPRCPTCYPLVGTSSIELEIVNFCQDYCANIENRNKSIIPPYEIDIYLPNINLGIEMNGIYWHSEVSGKKNREYHQLKLLLALQKQINLVQIFEDEWLYKQDIVKSILLNKFRKNNYRIFARKCDIYSVPIDVAKQFYDTNHLQGFINGTHLGLYYNNEFVSMITVGSPRFDLSHDLEIYRFCNKNNTSVIGSLSRLIHAINQKPKSIITYVDARYGVGLSYYKCGFKFIGTTDPGYSYVKHNTRKRLSRLHFQKHLLKDKLEFFDPNLSEWENMQLNGYDRIWDCGNFIYELNCER